MRQQCFPSVHPGGNKPGKARQGKELTVTTLACFLVFNPVLVPSTHSDLVWRDALLEEPGDALFHGRSFCPVEVRRATRRDLLYSRGHEEKHGLGGHGPREVHLDVCLCFNVSGNDKGQKRVSILKCREGKARLDVIDKPMGAAPAVAVAGNGSGVPVQIIEGVGKGFKVTTNTHQVTSNTHGILRLT